MTFIRQFLIKVIRNRKGRIRKWLAATGVFLLVFIASAFYLIAANPYASDSFADSPYSTSIVNGQVVLKVNFRPRFYSGWVASAAAYYEEAVMNAWHRLSSPKMKPGSESSIVRQIYALDFNPNKPFLISGDQFGGLYIRNLSVFYQSLLDPNTAVSVTDWQNRERIAVQSLAYALNSMQQLKHPVTTLMPISPHGALAVNFWSYPSDSMFSIFELLSRLESLPATRTVALQLQHQYSVGITESYRNYLSTVKGSNGLIKTSVRLSGARDAAQRQSSFYDNVILWKTEQLATSLGFDHLAGSYLAGLRQTIIGRYWDNAQGHFIDDVAPGDQNSYSSDWLIALPLQFLNPSNPADLSKLIRISGYIDRQKLAEPLPIRYTNSNSQNQDDLFVRIFAGSYGTTAIWSYWGDLYITLETDLYQQTGNPLYAAHVESAIKAWDNVIVRDRGYPETLDSQGKMYETAVYESIRRNGWVVDFEAVKYDWQHLSVKRD
jgi:hypothetical protein